MANTSSNFFALPTPREAVKVLEQVKVKQSKSDLRRDAGRPAKLAGKRISKTGKVYWETRSNRSDAPLKDI